MDRKQSRDGLIYGVSSYVLWGLIPLYFNLLVKAGVGPLEILAHRVFWSFLMFVAVVTISRRWTEFVRALRDRETTLKLLATTGLIGTNWLTFLYAVSTGQVLQSSLAYFATPLLIVLLGVVFLGERLRRNQLIAIGLAAVGLVAMAVVGQTIPWVATSIALSFAFYSLLRKTVAVDGVLGLLFETMMLSPFCLGYLVYLHVSGKETFASLELRDQLLLLLSGLPTALPLLLFAASVRRMQLSTLGILQYLSPTIQFVVAIAVLGEPFQRAKLVCFAFIWLAVLIYCADSWRHFRRATDAVPEPATDKSPAVREPAAGFELDA